METAKAMIEAEGITVLSFVGEEDGVFIFACKGEDDSEIEVCVIGDQVVIAPT